MIKALFNYLALAGAYSRLNLNAQLEYRGAFVSQVLSMFLNNSVWIAFWWLFFTRFPVLRGWTIEDVLTVWAISAGGFGLAHAVYGNALGLAGLIAQGQLDVWLLYPRSVLPHLLLGRMSASAIGDALFGVVVFLGFTHPSGAKIALFALLLVAVAALYVGFSVLSASLAFWLGNASALSEQWRFAVITFSTYPDVLFEGAVKLVLYTLIPAGFISGLPVEALRTMSLGTAMLAVLGCLAVLGAGVLVFYAGLRRYESGNLLEMRG